MTDKRRSKRGGEVKQICKLNDNHTFNNPDREAARKNPELYRCTRCNRSWNQIMGIRCEEA